MKELMTNLIVRIKKSVWYDFKLTAESKGLKKDEAFEIALSDFVKKNKKG